MKTTTYEKFVLAITIVASTLTLAMLVGMFVLGKALYVYLQVHQ